VVVGTPQRQQHGVAKVDLLGDECYHGFPIHGAGCRQRERFEPSAASFAQRIEHLVAQGAPATFAQAVEADAAQMLLLSQKTDATVVHALGLIIGERLMRLCCEQRCIDHGVDAAHAVE
jgi:hypothetical protein